MLQTSGYVMPQNIVEMMDKPVTLSKRASTYALNDQILIKQVDSEGKGFIEVWKLWNPWIKAVNFGTLDYTSDELVNIQMTIAYDWAELNPAGMGVYAPFGQASEAAASRAVDVASGRPGGSNYDPAGPGCYTNETRRQCREEIRIGLAALRTCRHLRPRQYHHKWFSNPHKDNFIVYPLNLLSCLRRVCCIPRVIHFMVSII